MNLVKITLHMCGVPPRKPLDGFCIDNWVATETVQMLPKTYMVDLNGWFYNYIDPQPGTDCYIGEEPNDMGSTKLLECDKPTCYFCEDLDSIKEGALEDFEE